MEWYKRHPVARMLLGYLLHIPSMLGLGYLIYVFADYVTPLLMSAGIADSAGVMVSPYILPTIVLMEIGIIAGVLYKERQNAKAATLKFDSTTTGKQISKTIKAICAKNNLSVPQRALGSGYSSDGKYWAYAKGWPNTECITISQELYDDYKNKLITQKELERVIGHELGHIYYKHSLTTPAAEFRMIFSSIMIGCFILSTLLCLNIGVSTLLFSNAVNVESLALLGNIQLFNFSALILKHTSEISGMIISRASESQAELAACKFGSPKSVYKINLRYSKNKQLEASYIPEHSFTDKIFNTKKAFLNYYNSWCETHPSRKENANDIALYYPSVKNPMKQ